MVSQVRSVSVQYRGMGTLRIYMQETSHPVKTSAQGVEKAGVSGAALGGANLSASNLSAANPAGASLEVAIRDGCRVARRTWLTGGRGLRRCRCGDQSVARIAGLHALHPALTD